MSVPSDVVATPVSPPFQAAPIADPGFEAHREDEAAQSFREINARRAQIENPEMLRRLRGL